MQVILNDIKTSIENLARKINAPKDLLPSYEHATRKDHPYIKVDEYGQLFYVIVEYGEELDYPSPDTNDLLYRVFRSIAFSMASAFLKNNPIAKKDYRRQYFSKQLEILSMLNKDWRDRADEEHKSIIKLASFNDTKKKRNNYLK